MIAGFSQGGLGLPERDYYFREGKEAEEIRAGLRGAHRPDARTGRRQARRRPRRRPIRSWPSRPSWPRPRARSSICAIPRRTTTSSRGPRWTKLCARHRLGAAISPRSAFRANETTAAGPPAGVLHGLRRPAHLRAARGLARLPPLASPLRDGQLSSASRLWTSISPSTARSSPARRSCGRAGSGCWPRRTRPSARIWASST